MKNMTRELNDKEKKWARQLKAILRQKPKTIRILQSNEGGELLFYDSTSGEQIEDTPSIHGFQEGDPLQKLKYGEDGEILGWGKH